MFKNYIKIAWRNFLKDRMFTILNLTGLATGLACTLLIYMWVSDEVNVDKYNEKDSQLYQVLQNSSQESGDIQTAEYTPGILAKSLAEEMPEVEYGASVVPSSWFATKGVITLGDVHLKASEQFVSKDYFNVFTTKFIHGDPATALTDKYSIVLTKDLALKLFNTTENLVGKQVQWNHEEFNGPFLISAIIENNPPNATARFDLLLNYELFMEKRYFLQFWWSSDPSTFIILKKATDVAQFNKKIAGYIKSKHKEATSSIFAVKYADKYLKGRFENGVQAGGRIEYVRLFSIIAIFILIIACINFMNLSTVKASKRAKEVGIKKVIGASRRTLIFQYIGESMLMTFIALIFTMLLILLLLPDFNRITGKNLSLSFDPDLILTILGVTMLTGLISGSYPALYMSGFNPVTILKGKLRSTVSELWVRKGLVVFQFIISVVLIISVLVVYNQIKYIQSKNLGYNRDNVVHFEMDIKPGDSLEIFLDRIRAFPGVVKASSFYHNIATGYHGGTSELYWPGRNPNEKIDFANLEVGYDFIETLDIELKEGRAFSRELAADRQIMFNEAAIKVMGLKDPVGKTVKLWNQEKQIVGVVKDFHYESLYENIKPCFFQVYPNLNNVIVKIKAGSETPVIEQVGRLFREHNNGLAFEYKFLDDEYQAMYTAEQRVSILSQYFVGLAIIISCLGLFGLAAFTAQRRQKEISIRKVSGATPGNIVVMLSADFLKLILVALLVAFPLAWWATQEWLRDFVYRVDIGIGIFLIAGGAILLITLLTISLQSIKAALTNPVKSLKAE